MSYHIVFVTYQHNHVKQFCTLSRQRLPSQSNLQRTALDTLYVKRHYAAFKTELCDKNGILL